MRFFCQELTLPIELIENSQRIMIMNIVYLTIIVHIFYIFHISISIDGSHLNFDMNMYIRRYIDTIFIKLQNITLQLQN